MAAAARLRRWPADLHRISRVDRERRGAATVRRRTEGEGRAGQLSPARPLLRGRPELRCGRASARPQETDRKRVVQGQSVSVRVDTGGAHSRQKKTELGQEKITQS